MFEMFYISLPVSINKVETLLNTFGQILHHKKGKTWEKSGQQSAAVIRDHGGEMLVIILDTELRHCDAEMQIPFVFETYVVTRRVQT